MQTGPNVGLPSGAPEFVVRLAQSAQDIRAAQRLRYRVFVTELGGDGDMVDHELRIEQDRFDSVCEHLLLVDAARERAGCEDAVVGVYRLLRGPGAQAAGGFYSEGEYDLAPLKSCGRNLLELGRSCLDAPYRGGAGMHSLWQGLAQYVADHQIEILFGVASFHGTDIDALAEPLSLLHHRHLSPEHLRPRARDGHYQRMDLMPEEQLDRRAAMRQVPSLIKAYLRLGGCVGEGAFVDHAFNTTDVCLIMDTERLSASRKSIYTKQARG